MALKPAHLQWSGGDGRPVNNSDGQKPGDGVLRSADYGDIYFQPNKGRDESHYVFLEKNHLPGRFAAAEGGMQVAELGFGTGLNFLLTAQLWQERARGGELLYVSIEKHPLTKADLARVLSFWPEFGANAAALLAQYPPALEGFYHLRFKNVRLMLCLGDVADVLPALSGAFDAWYLDGFSPAKNPAMWSADLFPLIAARTKPGGTLSTFSSAGAVRSGLAAAGFAVEKVPGYGVKRDMTVAQMPGAAPVAARKRVVVLGAGLGGASAAHACAEQGCDVTVIDRQPGPAQETSGNPVGVLYPKLTAASSPLGAFYQHGFMFTRNLVTALGLPSWQPCGVDHLDVDDDAARRHAALAASGYWPEDFLRHADGALHLPLGGALSPPELCRRLLDHPRITTQFSRSVSSLESIEADAVVVALAQGTKEFAETAGLPLGSLRGQLTFLRATEASKNLDHVICHAGYLPPAVDGIHYAGATFSREAPEAPTLRAEDEAENLNNLTQYVPSMGFTAADVAGGRVGYRTTVPDHLPIVGRCPDQARSVAARVPVFHERLYLSTGFGGHGLSGAPLAGAIVASQIMGLPLPVPSGLAPHLAPERFILRDIKRGKI